MTIFPYVITSQLFPLRHILSKWRRVSYLRHILGGLNWTILCNNNSNKRPHVPATVSQAYAHSVFDLHSITLRRTGIKKWLKQAQSSPQLFTLLYHVMESFITYILISHQKTAIATQKKLKKGCKRVYLLFLSFRCVLNVNYSFLGNSPASEF